MTETHTHLNNVAERGLPDGLGAENTQPGTARTHTVEPEALVYGLGSAETQSDAGDPGHIAFDHTQDGAESGLPLGLGSEDSQPGPAVPHPPMSNSLEFGLGSAETQHELVN